MARTLDELVSDALGAQILAILRLQVENQGLKEQIAVLEQRHPLAPKPVSAEQGK